MATSSIITQVTGQAWARDPNGNLTPLREGMVVSSDATIVTADGASVQLQPDGMPPLTIGGNRNVQLSAVTEQAPDPGSATAGVPADPEAARVLAALQAGEDPFAVLDPTAAVLAGTGGDDGGSSFTRIAAIVETTTPLGLEYPRPVVPNPEDIRLGGISGDADAVSAVVPPATGPGGPTINIPDHNDTQGGDGQPPQNVPGTFSIFEGDTEAGVVASFNITAPGGLDSLIFRFSEESDTDGGDATPTETTLSFSLDQLMAATDAAPLEINTDRGMLFLTGYDPATGDIDYRYVSDGWQDHSFGDTTSVLDTLEITVLDSQGRTATANLVANITDDTPLLNPLEPDPITVGITGTNVMLILDLSGSMNFELDSNRTADSDEESRLYKLKEALDALFLQFEAQLDAGQDIKVNIIGFASDAWGITSGWVSLTEAQAEVTSLNANGSTNYDAALLLAMAEWGKDDILIGENVANLSYFLSDGEPTASTSWGSGFLTNNGISDPEEAKWEEFLEANDINSYAVGMGNSAGLDNLQPIGHNGVDPDDTSQHVFEVSFENLAETIVEIAQGEADGNVITDSSGRIGEDDDGAYIQSVTIDEHTYTFNGTDISRSDSEPQGAGTWSFNADSVLLVHTDNGVFRLDLQGEDIGDYTYQANEPGQEVVSYTLRDGDGDLANGTLTLNAVAAEGDDSGDLDTLLMFSENGENTVISNNTNDKPGTESGNHITTLSGVAISDLGLDAATDAQNQMIQKLIDGGKLSAE